MDRHTGSFTPGPTDGSDANSDFGSARSGLRSIANQVSEYLAQLTGKSAKSWRGLQVTHKPDTSPGSNSFKEASNLGNESAHINFNRLLGIAMERQGLFRNSGNSIQLMAGVRKVFMNCADRIGSSSQIDQIGERFEWIVDLMRNCACQFAGCCQFFRCANGIFGEFAIGNVGENNDLITLHVPIFNPVDRNFQRSTIHLKFFSHGLFQRFIGFQKPLQERDSLFACVDCAIADPCKSLIAAEDTTVIRDDS